MDIFYGKKSIRNHMIEQIIELFATNYGEYHYEKLRTYEGIASLVDDKQFECVFIVDKDKVCGFSGYYVKSEPQDDVKEILLAHLLVDINSRGKGYGNVLEDSRLKMIQELDGEKVIYASCVEKPYNSIKMKQNRGFFTGGFRYCYRPGKGARGNAVIMVYTGNLQQEIYIETPHIFTQKLLKIGNPIIKFKAYKSYSTKHFTEIFDISRLGRRICHVSELTKGEAFDEKYLNRMRKEDGYVGVYISPAIDGFRQIDDLLISNLFFPLCYIPYIKGGHGLLEYQYLPKGVSGLLTDEGVSQAGMELLSYLYV